MWSVKPSTGLMIVFAQAVLAEYLVTTLFLFITIGTVSSNCHTGDNITQSSTSGADKSLTSGEARALFVFMQSWL